MTWKCSICDREFDSIPKDGVVHGRRVIVFADGAVHSLFEVKRMSAEGRHNRWHKASKKSGCEFCFPPPKPEPLIMAEQSQEVQVPEKLPEIIIEEVKPGVVAEIEGELTTALAIAFRRRKQIQN